jgi:propionyl-CoA synthetase
LEQVELFAGVLVGMGCSVGDRVIIYMPMIIESAIAMLACARIGVVHSVVFGGFSAPELHS